jgi:branched-chain amino acid transport system permease protein
MGNLTIESIQLLPGLNVGLYPLAVLILAAAVIGLLQLFLYKTPLGAAIRATSDDATTIRLMGLDNRHIFGVATALSFAVAALAGILMGGYTNFSPASGPSNLLFGFEAIIIGGLGNLWGTLLGGMILGVAQAVGAEINPGYQILAGHVAFLAILLIAPRGLFPKMAA